MKLKTIFVLLSLATFAFVNWGIDSQNQQIVPNSANAVTSVNATPVGRIIEADGQAFLKRKNWSEYRPTFVGTELYAEDQIKLESEANLMAICYENWETWRIPANTVSQPLDGCLATQCVPTDDGCVPFDASRIGNQVFAADNIPYIISPRHTYLLSNQPLVLRWNPVANATRYTVKIKSPSEEIWETEVSENQVTYSEKNIFKPDLRYTVIIYADTEDADTEVSSLDVESPFPKKDPLGEGFIFVSEAEQQQILATAEQLTQQLGGEAQVLTLAGFYQRKGLNTEAIAILESFIEKGYHTAAVYQMLGTLYQQIQLPVFAQEYYLKSLGLIEIDDVAGSAEVQAALGEVYAALGEKEKAIHWLKLANNSYQELGESERGEEVQKLLEGLNS
ncbi:MAG: tetratricopeptide repeat protein [Cyanobacteria bacterium J06592_8]